MKELLSNAAKRAIRYLESLGDLPGVSFMPEPPYAHAPVGWPA